MLIVLITLKSMFLLNNFALWFFKKTYSILSANQKQNLNQF